MKIDFFTLCFALASTNVLIAAVFLAFAKGSKDSASQRWWGTGYLLVATGTILLGLRSFVPDFVSIVLANLLVIASWSCALCGLRAFDRRPLMLWPGLLAAAVWIALCFDSRFMEAFGSRVMVMSIISAGFSLLWARMLWRYHSEGLTTRAALFWLALAHAATMMVRAGLSAAGFVGSFEFVLSLTDWPKLLEFEGALISTVIAMLLLMMTRERAEHRERTIAAQDELTGVFNRRAFMAGGRRLLADASDSGSRVALMVFDLDHFKDINDRYGHPAGDAVIRRFADIASVSLRQSDVFARIGGEEFAAIMTGVSPEEAQAIAERVRQAFARNSSAAPEPEMTVSIGLAWADGAEADLGELMKAADGALYAAKRGGRNRVALAGMVDRPVAAA